MKSEEEAIRERDEFLKEHPNMIGFQNEIDDIMSKTPEDKRLEVLGIMLEAKEKELLNHLIDLRDTLKNIQEVLKNEQGN